MQIIFHTFLKCRACLNLECLPFFLSWSFLDAHLSMLLHVGKTARKYLIQECDLQQKRWYSEKSSVSCFGLPTSLTSPKKSWRSLNILFLAHLNPPDGKRVVIETEKWLITIFPAVKHTHKTYKKEALWNGLNWHMYNQALLKNPFGSQKTRCLSISFCQTYHQLLSFFLYSNLSFFDTGRYLNIV